MKRLAVWLQISAIALAGCSTTSKDIVPENVSPMMYSSFDCDQIAAEQRRIYQKTGEVGGKLDQAASNDKALAWSSLLLWPTLFWLGGTKEQESQYAHLKGQYDALEQAAIQKKCAGAMAPAQQATPNSVPTPSLTPAGAVPASAPTNGTTAPAKDGAR